MSHSSGIAGAERSLLAIVTELAHQGNEVEVWLPNHGPLEEFLLKIPLVQIRIVSNHWWLSRRGGGIVGLARLFQVVVDSLSQRRRMRWGKFDVVLVNSIVAPAAMFAASSIGIPVVTAIRESFRTNPTLRGLLPRDTIASLVKRGSATVICVSEYTAAQYGHPSVVISPPISRPTSASDSMIPGGESKALRLVMMGSIGGDKGQVDAVVAVSSALASGAIVELDLYGGGRARDLQLVDELIERLGVGDSVRRHSEIRDVAGVLTAADFSLVLSRNEAFGRVTVEALLVGTPVVGFDCGGTSEIIKTHGGGVLIPPTSESLVQLLVQLALDRSIGRSLRVDAQLAGQFWSEVRPEKQVVAVLEAASVMRRDD